MHRDNPTLPKAFVPAESSSPWKTLIILPHKTNKSVKALYICVVPENTALKVGSCVKYSTWLHLVLCLPLAPTPCAVFSRTTLVMVL